MRPKLTDEDCRKLADFLGTLDGVAKELKQWLASASSDQIRIELIDGITWQTSAEAVEYVERAVNRRLAAMGEAGGIPPSVTRRISRLLFDEIWKVLRQKNDRFVDRLRFQQLWEEETRLSVFQPEYEMLVRAAAAKATGGHGSMELFQNGAPPFAGILSQRCS